MKKILALDTGDVWVGSALSDTLGITCKPYQTITLDKLESFLATTLVKEHIDVVVVGKPTTLSGKNSEQTNKVIALFEQLRQQFATVNDKPIEWKLWDERLSSKRAQTLKIKKNDPGFKKKEHSLAAAFILQTYLDHLSFLNS